MAVVANVAINVDSSQAVRDLNKVDAAAGKLNQSFAGIKAAIAALGIGVAIKSIADVGQQSERSQLQIKALTAQYGDLAQASTSVDRIQKVLGISAIEASNGYSQLYAALRGTGVNTEQLEVLFVGLTKAARLSGAGAAEAQGALLQLKQAFASGTLQGDELRSVLEAMPAFTQALAKETDRLGMTSNATSADIKKLGSEGKITSDILFAAAQKLATANAPGLTSAEKLAAAFKNLQERIAQAFGPAITKAVEYFSAAIAAIGNWFANNQQAITNIVKSFISFARVVGPIAFGIWAVVKAYEAWNLISKAVAATQAFITALSGPKGLAMVAGAGLAAGVAYATLNNALKGTEEELKKQKAEAAGANAEFGKIVANVDPIASKTKAAADATVEYNAKLQETLTATAQAKADIEAQVASLERGASINSARYEAEKAINDLHGQQLERQYELAGSAQERLNIAVAIFRQQAQAAQIEYNQALSNIALEERKLALQVESAQLKLKEIEAEGQLQILKSKDAKQAADKRAQLQQALTAQRQVVDSTAAQIQAQQQISQYSQQTAAAQYESKILAAQTALEQKLVSDKIGMSQSSAVSLSNNLASGARQTGTLATGTAQVATNASNAAGNFIRVASAAEQAAGSINNAANAQARLNALQNGGGGKPGTVKKAATGAFWPGGFKAYAKGGIVNRPTLGLIGEGGEAEYIIPESKAMGFAMNYLLGGRGGGAIPRFAEGGMVGTPSVSIQTGPVTQMNGTNYVTTQDMSRAVQAGVQQTLNLLRNDIGARSSLGLA